MIHATAKMRSPLKWHGGKTYLARRIIALFPEHHTYIEPFIGGGSILLNKPKSTVEIAGDLNADLIRFWQTLAERGFAVAKELECYPYTPKIFAEAGERLKVKDILRDTSFACEFLARNRMSRGGLWKDFAWSDRLRGGQPGELNSWQTIQEELPSIVARIRDIKFIHEPAIELILNATGRGTLIYCDPPYLHETRTHTKAYEHEMTADDHHDLISALKRADERGCKVFLSGYRSDLYERCIPPSWTLHTFEMANHSGQGKSKQRRIECLWESPSGGLE